MDTYMFLHWSKNTKYELVFKKDHRHAVIHSRNRRFSLECNILYIYHSKKA